MEYKSSVKCDVCNKAISMPNGRIEWNFKSGYNDIHICHHDCSFGADDNYCGSLSDIILDQGLYTPDIVYSRMLELQSTVNSERIIALLF